MAQLYETFYQIELDKLKPMDETNAINKTAEALSNATLKYIQSNFDLYMKMPYFLVSGVNGTVPVSGIPAYLTVNILDNSASILRQQLINVFTLYNKINQSVLYSKIFQTIGSWINTNIFLSVKMTPNDGTILNQFSGFTIWNCPNFGIIPGIFTDLKDKITTEQFLLQKSLDPSYISRDDADSLPQLKISILTDGLMQGFAGNIITPIPILPGTGLASSIITAGTAIPISPSILFVDTPSGDSKLSQLNFPSQSIQSLLRPKMSQSIEPQVNDKKTSLDASIEALKKNFTGSDLSILDQSIKNLQNIFNTSVNVISSIYTNISFGTIFKNILILLFPLLIVMFLFKFINGMKIGLPSQYIKLIDNDPTFDATGLVPTFEEVKSLYPTNTTNGELAVIKYFKDTFNIDDSEVNTLTNIIRSSNTKPKLDPNEYQIKSSVIVNKIKTISVIKTDILSITNNQQISKHIAGAIRVY